MAAAAAAVVESAAAAAAGVEPADERTLPFMKRCLRARDLSIADSDHTDDYRPLSGTAGESHANGQEGGGAGLAEANAATI